MSEHGSGTKLNAHVRALNTSAPTTSTESRGRYVRCVGDAVTVRSLLIPAIEGVDTKDKGYRRYVAGVERVLASFETTQQEWADYISFLGRLLKALQARPNDIRVIPESQNVALHLAQCLSPALPSGVHQKALEVYAFVFSIFKVN